MTLDERKSTPDLTAALNQLWTRFLPEIHDRVAILESVAQACATDNVTPELSDTAHAAAHKLAGTLGTFSLAKGSELAREFEQYCASEESCASAPAIRLTAIAAEIRTIIDTRK